MSPVGWVEERNPTSLLSIEHYRWDFVPQPNGQWLLDLIIKLTLMINICSISIGKKKFYVGHLT